MYSITEEETVSRQAGKARQMQATQQMNTKSGYFRCSVRKIVEGLGLDWTGLDLGRKSSQFKFK
jgi:hypothetical protein